VLALGGRPSDRPFTSEDRELIQAVAHRAGQAIQNARLYRASQEQSVRLATLNAITAAAVSSLEMDEVLNQVLKLACQALDAEEGAILLSDPDTEGLFFALTSTSQQPRGRKMRGQRLAAERCEGNTSHQGWGSLVGWPNTDRRCTQTTRVATRAGTMA